MPLLIARFLCCRAKTKMPLQLRLGEEEGTDQ